MATAVPYEVPRFFFHLYDDVVSIDEEGSELPDIAAVRQKAIKNARSIACQEVLEGTSTSTTGSRSWTRATRPC